ncbi:Tfp pilus assembly protein PilF [Lentzea waywayandensis]|uniref:Tfp pilus assembly protein PilF n=1 Tax=Lentzea waywayandensis TaxID=84724 RepID=A0A1I6DH99_9PSEU|nr:trypsin-like peptidase domain-containing protein [Lentzea waywayandensis]SFR04767.1 Tfp pilus assembly protein PilF [Lentzea waywayandensis]
MSAGPWADRPPWLVQVRRGPGQRAEGAGVLVTADHVLTCAHVVAEQQGNGAHPEPDGPVHVLFQYGDDERDNEELLADVVGWSGVDTGLDFAVLRLREGSVLPSRARPAPLANPFQVNGHSVGVCGYPSTGDDREQPWHGKITHSSDTEFTLEADGVLGFELERGFSGGPLWDNELGGVIGIVSQRMKARRPDSGVDAASIRLGTALRVDAIAKRWHGLPTLLGVTPWRLATLAATVRDEDRLPAVGEAGLNFFGIYPETPEYAARTELDAKLDAVLRESRHVVVTGEMKAGKSRSLAEAVRRFAADRTLIVPKEATAVAELANGPLPTTPAGAVVWLEHLERYLVPGGLDKDTLDRLCAHEPPITVVATMHSGKYLEYRKGTGPLGNLAKQLLDHVPDVGVRDRLDQADHAGAKAAYPRFDPVDARLGNQLFSGPTFEWMVTSGRDTSPVGWAVMMAAVEWRRTGADSPIPEADLRALVVHYLRDDEPEPDDKTFAEALSWAADAAIRRVGDAYVPENYLVGMVEREEVEVRPETWWHVARSPAVTPTDLLIVTHNAVRLGLPAELALAAADSARLRAGDPAVASWASLLCGQMEGARGDIAVARERLGEVISSGNAEVVAFAQIELGVIETQAGHEQEAEELLVAALASDSPHVRRLAKANLATIRWGQADLVAAEVMLEEVVASAGEAEPLAQAQLGAMLASQGLGHREQQSSTPQRRTGPVRLIQSVQEFSGLRATNLAQTNLGILKIDQGQADRARVLLEASLAANDPVIRPIASAGMGRLLLVEGDLDGADRYFDQAIESGEWNASGLAGVGKAAVAQHRGDFEGAVEELARVADEEHPHYGPMAAYMLGDLLRQLDNGALATEAYQAAIDSGHRDWSQAAKVGLAILWWTSGSEDARARELLDEVIGTGHRDNGPWAATVLGELLAERKQTEDARAAYQRAIDSQHTDWAVTAAVDLALLMWNQEDAGAEEVVPILRAAADSGHQHQAPRANELLGDILNATDDVEGARAAYLRTVESDHPFWSGAARVDLAILEVNEDSDTDRVVDLLDGACDSGFDIIVSTAHLLRGMIHHDREDFALARADLEIAAERAVDADVATQSTYWLTVLDLAANDRTEAFAHAEVLMRHLEEWSGIAPPPTDEPAEGVRILLRLIDHLYVLGLTDRSELLTELESSVDGLDPADRAGVRARSGRRLFQDERYAEAESVLRPLLAEELRWEDEAIVRRYLAALQVLAKPQPEATSLDAAWDVLTPFLDRTDPANGASALQLLGQIAVLRGRRERIAGRDAEAQRHFDEGAELLRRAESSAREQGDTDTADEALSDLERLPEAKGEARAALPPAAPAVAALEAAPEPAEPEKPSTEIWRLLGEVASAEGARHEAEHWLRRADQQNPRTELAFAVLELEAGEADAARTRVSSLLDRTLPADDRARADQLMADIDLLA